MENNPFDITVMQNTPEEQALEDKLWNSDAKLWWANKKVEDAKSTIKKITHSILPVDQLLCNLAEKYDKKDDLAGMQKELTDYLEGRYCFWDSYLQEIKGPYVKLKERFDAQEHIMSRVAYTIASNYWELLETSYEILKETI